MVPHTLIWTLTQQTPTTAPGHDLCTERAAKTTAQQLRSIKWLSAQQ